MAEVCVFGLGYVGLPTASLLASAGFNVLGVDTDPRVRDALTNGRTNLKEAGLATIVSAAVQSHNLVAAAQPEPSDIFMLCVPTPTKADHTVDLASVEAVTRSIVPLLRRGNMVILESTSPVGTTRNVVGRILRESGLEPGRDFDLCYCPERVLPGNTVRELVTNSRIIGGTTLPGAQRAAAMYERFCEGTMTLTDDQTAELCKLMENTHRDVNIALANTFARVAERVGTNVWKAIEYANLHPRVNILDPGPGVGGHCIPVDPWFLIQQFPAETELLRAARTVNDTQGARMLDRMIATGELKAGDKLAVLGAAYKADIDDPRESPAFGLAEAAEAKGLFVAIHDPHVEPGDYGAFRVADDLRSCLQDAAAAILVTDHKSYRALSAKVFSEQMKGRLVADCRDWLNHASLESAGFTVLRTGFGPEVPSSREQAAVEPGPPPAISVRSGAAPHAASQPA